MPTKSVRVHLAGENIVALCDTGSDGMGVGMSLIKEGVRNLWPRKFGRRITPNTRMLTTVAGQTINILGKLQWILSLTENTAGNACSMRDDSANDP